MRFSRLDLTRYGLFTDVSIEFPKKERDIHIVYGPNEAGKTTSLRAIEDTLFGIPQRSPYNFLHSYQDMRVGAALENGDKQLEFQRRKGTNNVILGKDGLPLPGDEQLLVPFIGGADRIYFERMFNLSHDRLIEGGRTILDASDDVGQMLFAAGTGVADLRKKLKKLDEEADCLWGPRKSLKRLYYQGEDRWKDAQKRLRDISLTVEFWKATAQKLKDVENVLDQRRKDYENLAKELKKLDRIRHVHGAIRQLGEIKREIIAMGDVILLAEDAANQVEQIQQKDAKFQAQISVLSQQLDKAQNERTGINYDESLVRLAGEIRELDERRIVVRSEREDLPKRQEELRSELTILAKLATEINWSFERASDLIDRIPPVSNVNAVRNLLASHRELEIESRNAKSALQQSQNRYQEQAEQLREMGQPIDVARLAAVLKSVPDAGDVVSQIQVAKRQLTDITDEIEKKYQSMNPALPADIDVEALALPPKDTVFEHRDKVQSCARILDETRKNLAESRLSLERDRQILNLRIQEEEIVVHGAVDEARSTRDDLWGLIKARYVESSQIPIDQAETYAEALEDLPKSFEVAVEHADSVSDKRFDKAQAVGEVTVLERNITEQELRIKQLEAKEAILVDEEQRLQQAWLLMWSDLPIDVNTPDFMLKWLDILDDIVVHIDRKRSVERQLADHEQQARSAFAQVLAELKEFGWNDKQFNADELKVLVNQADAYRFEQETKAKNIERIQNSVGELRFEVRQRQDVLKAVEAEQDRWQTDWKKAVAEIDLRSSYGPDVVSVQISVIDELRTHAATARELRDRRITTIERDIESFEKSVAETVGRLAPDFVKTNADDGVIELVRRLDEAIKLYQKQCDLTDEIDEKRKSLDDLEAKRAIGLASMQPLLDSASVDNVFDLRESIRKSDKLRALNTDLTRVKEALNQQGDGLSIEELENECQQVNIDEVQVKKETAEAELQELDRLRQEAIVACTEARTTFESIGADDAAAQAAADREEGLASMRVAAESYVRIRASQTLLGWAIDRYQKEKQGPLLSRAGELFQLLTLGSFERLDVQFDDKDAMRLTGVRPKGSIVAVPNMSTGTEDQLFLALRIAAIEDYLGHAIALPFVADDLFINFDSERSAAGFEVLGQLAERTQVLFYTHHSHLVDLARETLGSSISVVTLNNSK